MAEISTKLSKKLERVKELASYCFSCGKCVVVCPTSILDLFSPKGFVHHLSTGGYENLEEFIATEPLFNCLTCEQCSVYCPMSTEMQGGEGVIIAEIVQAIREYGYENGLLDVDLEKNKTHDNIMQLYPVLQTSSDKNTTDLSFIKNDPTLKIKDKGEIAFFVGSSALLEDIFYTWNIKYKDVAKAVISILNDAGIEPVILDEKSSGHDNYWIGDVKTAEKLAKYNVDLYKKAGVKTIIIEDAEAYRMWKFDYPNLVDDFDFEILHFSEFILKNKLLGILTPKFDISTTVTYHDPCRLGRVGGKVYEPPREVLKSIPGVKLIEMRNIKDDANCCGVTNFKNCNTDTKTIRERRIKEAIETGADYLITTCPKCITHFQCYQNEPDDEGNDKPDSEKIKIMDLAQFIAKFTQKI